MQDYYKAKQEHHRKLVVFMLCQDFPACFASLAGTVMSGSIANTGSSLLWQEVVVD